VVDMMPSSTRLRRWWSWSALVVALAACGGGGGGDDGDDAPPTTPHCGVGQPTMDLTALDTAYCQPLAAAICAKALECRCDAIPDWPSPAAACETQVRGRCVADLAAIGDLIAAGMVAACPEAAAACVTAYTAAIDGCDLPVPGSVAAACGQLIPNSADVGGRCATAGLCAAGAGVCDGDGRCAALPADGQACQGVCAAGLVCNAAGKCAAPGGEGAVCSGDVDCAVPLGCLSGHCGITGLAAAPCEDDADCASGLLCSERMCAPAPAVCAGAAECGQHARCLATGRRTCVARPAIDEPCNADAECGPGAYCNLDGRCALSPGFGEMCADGVYCETELTCRSEDTSCGLAPGDGEACGIGEQGPFECAPGLACIEGRCHALPGSGQACGGGPHHLCAEGLGCDFQGDDQGACAARVAAGAACSNDSMCQDGLYCELTDLKCAAVRAAGQPCEDGNECGPAGACIPDEIGVFHCAAIPGAGGRCFDTCSADTTCRPAADHGACAPTICAAVPF